MQSFIIITVFIFSILYVNESLNGRGEYRKILDPNMWDKCVFSSIVLYKLIQFNHIFVLFPCQRGKIFSKHS